MLRIVTDGAGDMPPEWQSQFDVHMIPINIQFGDQTYLQWQDLSDADFYRLAEESGIIPTTAQPSPYQFKAFYRQIATPEDTVLSLHVTSRLSGTYASAVQAAKELAGELNIIPFDSAAGSAALGFMCREARQLDRSGASSEEILARLEFIRRNVQILLTLDSLEYAHKSGRVKALQALFASMLNIKPVVALKDGMLDIAGKVRTRSRALEEVLQRMESKFGTQEVFAAAVHAVDPSTGEYLFQEARSRLNTKEIILTDLAIGVAANLGPGTVGLVVYPTGKE